jgi:glycerol-3-phosphate dehydrogenase (NAD(P)+)
MERLLSGRVALEIWNRSPRAHRRLAPLESAVPRAGVVLLCVPTFPHAEILQTILPLLRPGCICLSVAKGLDHEGRPVTRILEAKLGGRFGFGVLHGPMIAEEIRAGRHAFAQLGCSGNDVAGRVTTLFADSRLHVSVTDDMVGINWAVILKNVYAMAFGMADELRFGDNVRGWLTVTALRELDAIVRHLGGKAGTALGLAGLGDLIATATSEHSHHHELGRRLARGETRIAGPGGLEGEAIRTLAVVERGLLLDESSFPLFRWVHDIVRRPQDVGRRLETLIQGAG